MVSYRNIIDKIPYLYHRSGIWEKVYRGVFLELFIQRHTLGPFAVKRENILENFVEQEMIWDVKWEVYNNNTDSRYLSKKD